MPITSLVLAKDLEIYKERAEKTPNSQLRGPFEGYVYGKKEKYYLYDTHIGHVLWEREQNLYHDSYFWATVWDPVKKEPKSFEYNSTAYAGGDGCLVDATPEVLAAVEEYRFRIQSAQRAARRKAEAADIRLVRKNVKEVLGFEGTVQFCRLRGEFQHAHWVELAKMLTSKRLRSGFKLSLMKQLKSWCLKENGYESPFSRKQLAHLNRMIVEKLNPHSRYY